MADATIGDDEFERALGQLCDALPVRIRTEPVPNAMEQHTLFLEMHERALQEAAGATQQVPTRKMSF